MNEFIRRPRQSGPRGKTWNNVYQLQQQQTFEAKNYSDIQTNKKSARNMKSVHEYYFYSYLIAIRLIFITESNLVHKSTFFRA